MPYLLTATPGSPTNWVKMETDSVLSGQSEHSQRSRPIVPLGMTRTVTSSSHCNSNFPTKSHLSVNSFPALPQLPSLPTTPHLTSPGSVMSNYSLNRNLTHLTMNNLNNYNNYVPRTNSVLSNHNNYATQRMESPYHTTVSVPIANTLMPNNNENIQVQILPQSDDWGDNTTAMTGLSDLAFGPEKGVNWGSEQEEGWRFQCQRYAGSYVSAILSVIAFFSPVLMIVLPRFSFMSFKDKQLKCDVECDGLLISFSFKLLILMIGSWAVFFRTPKSTMPRIFLFRSLVCVLLFIFVFSFWLFYGVRVMEQRRNIQYYDIVLYATSLVDALLFLHYLAVVLMELRHGQPQYYIKVVRSPDGESKSYAIGKLSIQRAAAWVLEQYYTDFPVYNPYLERLPCGKNRKGSNYKYYDVDGLGTINEKPDSRVGSPTFRKKDFSHNERFYEEYEYERRLKKRRARLITATEEAFAHIKRLNPDQTKGPSIPMDSYEAAQSIFPSIARPLQKYLRITRQQPRHTMDSILCHLATSLQYDMAPKAFLERYLITSPVLQSDREHRPIQTWALISDVLLSRSLRPGTLFQLRQNDISLLCEVHALPHFNITEEVVNPAANKFILKVNPETPV